MKGQESFKNGWSSGPSCIIPLIAFATSVAWLNAIAAAFPLLGNKLVRVFTQLSVIENPNARQPKKVLWFFSLQLGNKRLLLASYSVKG